nr:hypothetical protein [uncultured Prevotella sp.]
MKRSSNGFCWFFRTLFCYISSQSQADEMGNIMEYNAAATIYLKGISCSRYREH